MRFSYSPAVSQLQSTAVQAEEDALNSSHLPVAYLGGKEDLAMVQRNPIRFLFTHLIIRGWDKL